MPSKSIMHLYNLYKFLATNLDIKLGRPEFGDIMITTKCPVNCSFCIYSCTMSGEDMAEEKIRALSESYKKIGVKTVRIMGGEPFVNQEKLVKAFRIIKPFYSCKKITIVTSGFFAINKENAKKRLEELKKLALAQIQLSIDWFHLKTIPFQTYLNFLDVCKELSISVTLNIVYNDAIYDFLGQFKELNKRFRFNVRIGKLMPIGKALKLKDERKITKNKYKEFVKLFKAQGIKSRVIQSLVKPSCLHMVSFPNGENYYCCVNFQNSLIGNTKDRKLQNQYNDLKSSYWKNNMNIIKWFFSGKKTFYRCYFCPIKGK